MALSDSRAVTSVASGCRRHWRLLLCLLLGAGLALPPAALAAEDQAAKPAPAVDPARVVKPEVGKAINDARAQISGKAFRDGLATLQPVADRSDLTPWERLLVNRLRGVALVGVGDLAGADPVQEQVVADAQLAREDRLAIDNMMARAWYDKQPLGNAVKWGRRYFADGGSDDMMHTVIIQSLFKANDFQAAVEALKAVIADDDKAGRTPSENRLTMLSVCYTKLQDDQGHVETLERLVTLYPKPVYWQNLLANLERKPGFADYAVIDTYRLRLATDTIDDAADFIDWARLAQQAGYPAEARRALDAGVAKGVLGSGKGGAAYEKLRQQVDKAALEDAATLGQGDARAEKSGEGNLLFANGLNYVTHDKFDLGLPMMERGLQKGRLKRPEQARLQLGESYARAGRKDDALRVFAEVHGSDGSADLARLWTLFLKNGK